MLAAAKLSCAVTTALVLTFALVSCTTGPSRLQQQLAADRAAWDTKCARMKAEQEQDVRDMEAWREEPTVAELAAADCGPPPPPGWRVSLEAALRAGLRDPASGIFQLAEPEKVGTKAGEGAPFEFLWKVYYEVNARNGFGGYTGFQSSAVYFKDGLWISLDEHMRRQREWREHRAPQ